MNFVVNLRIKRGRGKRFELALFLPFSDPVHNGDAVATATNRGRG